MPGRQLRSFMSIASASVCWSLIVLLLGAPGSAAPGAGGVPSLDGGDLAQGPYSLMHMMLKKTILRINVATIDVRVDRQAQLRFAELTRGKPFSDALADELAPVAIDAGRATVQMRFNRNVSLDRWMGVVRDNLEQARRAGLIAGALEQQVSQGLPRWFGALRERGYEEGDRLIYSVAPDGLRTVVVSSGGKVLLDRTDRQLDGQPDLRRVVMASYFAPGSDFRQPLLRSLVESH